MKKSTKILALILATVMMAGVLCGCGGDKDSEYTATTDGKNFTYWTQMNPNSGANLSNYNEMLFFQEMEKITGVHIDFIHPIKGSTGNEAFIAMLTGAEKPDIIEYNWVSYTGGPQQALDDGVIICLNDYLEEHAPNFYEYMEGEKGKARDYGFKLQATTDDGRYYGFNVLNIGETRGFAGIYVRSDLLEKWGLAIPETIDEWTLVFAKAKEEGFQKPFTSICDPISFKNYNMHTFNTAYGVGKNFYLEGDKVVFGPFQKGYKEYVAQLAEWTKAGYIDTGFITNASADIEGNMTNGISVAAWGYVGGGIGKILPAAQAKDPTYDIVACPYPVANKGDLSEFSSINQDATTLALSITPSCGNYEKAVEWCDFRYSEEGVALQLFGVEGETYTIEEIDGEKHYVYTDKITDFSKYGFNSVNEALYHYMLPANHPGYNQHIDYLNGYYQMKQQQDAMVIWNEPASRALPHRLPTLGLTDDESQEITDIKEVAEPALEVALCDIIIGKKSIDTYDAAIKEAKANGYDRWIEIQQAAYDRYISKK